MCGIAGIAASPKHGLDPQELSGRGRRMLAKIAHRGPDGEGERQAANHRIWLGHRRLAIIDLDTGAQPMQSADGRLTITFNGCIYNYRELRSELEADGFEFRTTSDTEVIINAYARWGEDCLSRLNGMWSFAIWDEAQQRLWCSRDRLGIKPFYFHERADGTLIFASEIKALLASGLTPRAMCQDGLRQYLTFQFCLRDRTLFDGIQRLEPGHNLTWRPGERVRVACYWDLRFEQDLAHDEEWFVQELSALLEDSVRLRLRADVPLGAHLSGGLDSSTVVGFARRHLPSNAQFHTFVGAFDHGDQYDERPFARLVADRHNVDLHECVLEPDGFLETLAKITWHMDEPAAGPGVFPQFLVSKLASQHVKVVLGGQGGDELFVGYARYLIAYLEECIKGAIAETADRDRYIATLSTIIPSLPLLQNYLPLLRSFWSKGAFADPAMRYYHLMDRFGATASLLSPDLRMDHERTREEFRELFDNQGAASLINRILYFDTKTHLQSLLHVEDRTSMAWGLESRVPLLDHRLVELVATAPPTLKFRDGQPKYLFRKAIADVVPPAILRRSDKMGFPVPLTEWCRGPLNESVSAILGSKRAAERGIFDTEALVGTVASEASFGRATWGALSLEMWSREFLDSSG